MELGWHEQDQIADSMKGDAALVAKAMLSSWLQAVPKLRLHGVLTFGSGLIVRAARGIVRAARGSP